MVMLLTMECVASKNISGVLREKLNSVLLCIPIHIPTNVSVCVCEL